MVGLVDLVASPLDVSAQMFTGRMVVSRPSGYECGQGAVAQVQLYGPRGGYIGAAYVDAENAHAAVARISSFAGIKPAPVFVATMETTNFEFVAVGASTAEAVAGLVDAMRRHRAQYGGDTWHPGHYPGGVDLFCGGEVDTYPADDTAWLTYLATTYCGARVVKLTMGHGARDGEAI
jgi:hypothetical protein